MSSVRDPVKAAEEHGVLLLVYALLRFGTMRLNKFDETDNSEMLELVNFGKSLPTILDFKISEDTHCHVAGAVRIEVNDFLDMLRDVASIRDLKKFLTVWDGEEGGEESEVLFGEGLSEEEFKLGDGFEGERSSPEFEMPLVQQSALAPAVKKPIVFDRIGDHVEITGTSSGVKQKFTTPAEKDVHVERYKVLAESIQDASSCRNVRRRLIPTFSSMSANASELPALTKSHTKPAYSNENCGPSYRHCIPISTVYKRFRNMPAANVKSDSMSRLGVGKRLLSNIFSPRVPVDRPEPLSQVAESIGIDQNVRMCVAPSEEHATKVSWRLMNPCNNNFQSFKSGIPKNGDNHGAQYPMLTDIINNSIWRQSVRTRNHAYLSLDTKDSFIRPAIISFLNNIQENRRCSMSLYRVKRRKNTHSPLVVRAEEALSSRTVNTDRKRKNTSSLLAIRPEDALFTRSIRGDIHQLHQTYAVPTQIEIPHPTTSRISARIRRMPELYVYDTRDELSNKIHHFVRLFRTARDRCNAGDIPSFKIRLYNMGGVCGYELPTADVLGAIVFENRPRSRTDFYQSRLNFIRRNQNDLRSDFLSGLYDVVSKGDRKGITAGLKIMLPILYTIEFQKRGLPHCHTLLWIESRNTLKDAPPIDEYISTKIPDPVQDPRGYKLVTELTMHERRGAANLGASYMQNGPCNKHFPKQYNEKTYFDINGHTQYRRRDIRIHVMKGESKLDNCNVVPYNRALCLAFEAHINVEYCGWSMLIKYLFKYISKGPDCILAKISNSEASTSAVGTTKKIDEIQNYVDGRFICPYEACWRIFDFPIHCREPAKGFKSPDEVRTVNGQMLPTFRAVCEALGLLGDDKEWDITLEDSTASATSKEIRIL
ncbi:hypothetical protein Tco_0091206 [Tanacetum coccineum]